jgi:hypothetical protein
MINSYRTGGRLNVHWMYTDNRNNRGCISDWDYCER